MKKMVVLLAAAALFSQQTFAEKVICKKRIFLGEEGSFTLVGLEKSNSYVVANDENFCISQGYYLGVATPEDIKQFEEKNKISLDLKSFTDVNNSFFMRPSSTNLDSWLFSGAYNSSLCTPDSTNEQDKLLNELKAISSEITCDSLGIKDESSSKNPNKSIDHTPAIGGLKAPKTKSKRLGDRSQPEGSPTLYTNVMMFNKITSCYCLSKVGSPLKVTEELKNDYESIVGEHIKKEYINNLTSVKLYDFSLRENVLGSENMESCKALAKDKELQDSAAQLFSLPAAVKKIFGDLTQEDAVALYNLGIDQKEQQSIKIPIISNKGFKQFAKRWACNLNKTVKGSSIDISTFDALEKGLIETQKSRAELDRSLVKRLTLVTECDQLVPENEIDKVEQSYLEKMLSKSLGSGSSNLLADIFVDLKGQKITDESFEKSFKKIVGNHMESQCAISQAKLTALMAGEFGSVLSDSSLISALIAKRPQQSVDMQKLHCQMMKAELETRTKSEAFLREFCLYQKGDSLPPKNCPAIGDFLKATFIETKDDKNQLNPTGDQKIPNKDRIYSHIKHSSSTDYNSGASKVRAEQASTLSGIIKTAGDNFSRTNSDKITMDMDNYRLDKNPSLYNSNTNEDGTYTSKMNSSTLTPLKPFTQETSAPQGTNDIKAYEGFGQEVKALTNQQLPQSQAIPGVVYENKGAVALPQATATPQPNASQVVSTTVIEKLVTPTPDSTDKKDEEVTIVKTKKKKKIIKEIEEDEEEIVKQESPKSELSAQQSNLGVASGSSNKSASALQQSARMPTFQEAQKNPVLIPEESLKKYVEARRFEQNVVIRKDGFDSKDDGVADLIPPETGLMLSAFRTGKIAGKDVTKISIGSSDDIKDVKSFEQTNTFHGSVVIVEDQSKKERYICRAFITDSKDGVEKLLPVGSGAPTKDEMGGYKCTTEKSTKDVTPSITAVEKKEAQKALSSNERLYKAFVLEKIIKSTGSKEKKKK